MISAPSDPSAANGAESTPAGSEAGGTPNVFANGLPDGGSSAPASASPSASAPATAEASPNQQESQADLFTQRLREHEASQRQQWQEQVNQWRKQATEDPQLGGDNLPTTVARAQLALDRFDEGKRIGQLLEQTGWCKDSLAAACPRWRNACTRAGARATAGPDPTIWPVRRPQPDLTAPLIR